MDVGRINHFFSNRHTVHGSIHCIQTYPILLKYQKISDEQIIKLLENAGCTSKSLSTWATPVIIVSKKPEPLNPQQQQPHFVLEYWTLNKPINAAKLLNCTIFSSLDLRSGYHYVGLIQMQSRQQLSPQPVAHGTET